MKRIPKRLPTGSPLEIWHATLAFKFRGEAEPIQIELVEGDKAELAGNDGEVIDIMAHLKDTSKVVTHDAASILYFVKALNKAGSVNMTDVSMWAVTARKALPIQVLNEVIKAKAKARSENTRLAREAKKANEEPIW